MKFYFIDYNIFHITSFYNIKFLTDDYNIFHITSLYNTRGVSALCAKYCVIVVKSMISWIM